jgi:hypothetical protein
MRHWGAIAIAAARLVCTAALSRTRRPASAACVAREADVERINLYDFYNLGCALAALIALSRVFWLLQRMAFSGVSGQWAEFCCERPLADEALLKTLLDQHVGLWI